MHKRSRIGLALDELTLTERAQLRGLWIALEIYSPSTLPLKRIASLGHTAAECARDLLSRGLDPRRFEFMLYRGVSV